MLLLHGLAVQILNTLTGCVNQKFQKKHHPLAVKDKYKQQQIANGGQHEICY